MDPEAIGRAHDGRRRVVRARQDDAGAGEAGRVGEGAGEAADVRPGRHDLGQQSRRDAEALEHRACPVAGAGVEGLAGRRERVLGHAGAGQEVGEQVGHHQQPVGVPQERIVRARHRQELVDGVDGHELDAGRGVDLVPGHQRERALDHAVGPRVAVVDRVREQPPALVEQAEVHAPGVDADRGHATGSPRLAQAGRDVAEQPQGVPVHRPGHGHGHVREAVDVLDGEPPAVERAHEDPPALGADVDGGQAQGAALSQGGRPPRGAGGTPSPDPCRDR